MWSVADPSQQGVAGVTASSPMLESAGTRGCRCFPSYCFRCLAGADADRSVAYNRATYACAKCDEWQQALEVLSAASRRQVRSYAITYNAAISACERHQEWLQALGLLAMAHEQLQIDLGGYNMAMSACTKCSHWEQALELSRALERQKLDGDAITLQLGIKAAEQGSLWLQALLMLGPNVANILLILVSIPRFVPREPLRP